MIVKEINVWEAITNSDLNEGRGHSVSLGLFTSEELAIAAAKGQGVFGTDARVESSSRTVSVREIADSSSTQLNIGRGSPRTRTLINLIGKEVFQSYTSTKDLKSKALAKLTDEDKRVLGLK